MNKFKTQNTWGQSRTDLPQTLIILQQPPNVYDGKKQKKGRFLSPSLPSDRISDSQENRMSIFDSFTLPDELSKSVEK